MSNDSYKVIISLSHHRIAYEYWQRDGENKLVAMPTGNWPAPLAFFCSETGIIIGEDAARAAHNGIANAFDNYFERLADARTYVLGGQNRPIRNILLDASESIFRDFYKNILFSRFGSLSDNRADMPLTIVCESDIKPNERALLHGLFKDSGYNRLKVVSYDTYISQFIKEFLSKEYICDKVLVVWTEGSDLTITLFDAKGEVAPIQKTFDKLGIDPRKEYVENLIWERVIGQNPWLVRQDEQEPISKAANDFLSSTAPMINDTVLLSDGRKYHYSLNRNSIDYIQSSEGVALKEKLESFLRENTINRNNTLLLLRGIAAGNTYFENNLSQGFYKTIKSDRKLRDNTMKLIISEQNPSIVVEPTPSVNDRETQQVQTEQKPSTNNDIIKERKTAWRKVKAEAYGKCRSGNIAAAKKIFVEFYNNCKNIIGLDELLAEIQSEIKKTEEIEKTISSEPKSETSVEGQTTSADLSEIKELERKWRERKAVAKSKVRTGNITEAVDILQKFHSEVLKVPGTENLQKLVNSELEPLKKNIIKEPKSKHKDGDIHPNGKWVWVQSAAGGKGDWRTIGGRIHKQNVENAEQPTTPKNQAKIGSKKENDDGYKFIAAGQFLKAKEAFRAASNEEMAQLCSELNKSSRQFEILKRQLENCIKNKNKEAANKAIKEISYFITLLQKAKLDTTEAKTILNKYKSIK